MNIHAQRTPQDAERFRQNILALSDLSRLSERQLCAVFFSLACELTKGFPDMSIPVLNPHEHLTPEAVSLGNHVQRLCRASGLSTQETLSVLSCLTVQLATSVAITEAEQAQTVLSRNLNFWMGR